MGDAARRDPRSVIERGIKRCSVLLLLLACAQPPTDATDKPRVITFGDSNTDGGYQGSTLVANSYIDPGNPGPALGPNNPYTLAGMLDAYGIPAVNHGISGTKSGAGRIASSAPNARELVNGVTRFEAEVLGEGYPWSGGETTPISRVQSFQPGPCDYVYVSIGTNDGKAAMTAANIRWMIMKWIGAGYPPEHFMVTTLAPANYAIPAANERIRALALQSNVKLIEFGDFTSGDNGRTWRRASLHVGDGIHYGEEARRWIAARVAEYVLSRGCQ